MTRNFKALGLALVASLALGAVVASSASAAFEAESTPVRVTRSANNTQVFTYQEEGAQVQCSTVGGSGEQTTSPTTDFRFNPTYSGCTVPGIGTAVVSMNGCGYTFTANTGSTNLNAASFQTHLVCPEGATITITISSIFGDVCTLHLGSQTTSGTITGSNVGSGTTREVKVTSNVTGVSGTRTGSSLCGPTSSTTGTYTGEVTTTGENPSTNAHIGIFLD